MKILVYGISNQKGGISEFMMNLNEYLSSKNIHLNYIIKGNNSIYEEKILSMNGKVIYYNYANKFQRIFNLLKIMKNERKNTSIFYYNTSGTYFVFPIIFAKILGYKIISHAHSSKDNKLNKIYTLFNYINRPILRKFSKVKLTCSDVACDWVYGDIKDVIQINNAIDSCKYYYDEKIRIRIRKELNVFDDDIVLINIGRIEYPKNQKFLIDIMDRLNDSNKRNYKLYLVGDGVDSQFLKEYTLKNGIKNVYFLGQRNNVNELLNASDIFLLPSFFEGFPIVSVEAQATGLKCFLSTNITKSTNITGLVEYISIDDMQYWVEKIKKINIKERTDMNNILKSNGFDRVMNEEKIYLQIKKIIGDTHDS